MPVPAGHPTASSLIEVHRVQQSRDPPVIAYRPATVCAYLVVLSCYLVQPPPATTYVGGYPYAYTASTGTLSL